MKNRCAYCDREIAEDSEVFGFGAKVKQGYDLKDREGQMISLPLTQTNRTVPAIVVTGKSEAKRDGRDLMFMVCSMECGEILKSILQKEIDIEKIILN